MDTDILSSFTYELLAPYTGQTFQIRFTDGTLEVTLEQVEKLKEKHVDPKLMRDTFALYFRGPREYPMPQGTYAFFHETLGGPLPIFLVLLGSDANGCRYQAIFN